MMFRKFSFLLLAYLCIAAPDTTNASTDPLSIDEKEVVCFVYHRFGDDRYASTNVSLKNFRAHLQHLKDEGFQVLTFSDAIDYLQSEKPVKKTAVITIDDGYSSFYENGLPLLKEFGFPASLFINTETVGGNEYMDWEMLEKTAESGIEIGNHTHTHQYFLDLPKESRYTTFENELKQCQELIKKHLNLTPSVFAYPYGEWDPKMLEIVKKMGFTAAVAQNSGVISGYSDLHLCPRFPMSEFYAAPEKFASKASMHAFPVKEASPISPIMGGNNQPGLTVRINTENLQLNQLQCFVQGGECDIQSTENGSITVKASAPISGRRRTLYTLTVPNKQGEWYWYSHLWINK